MTARSVSELAAGKPRVLRRERLSDQVFDWVLESIRSGDYGPDDLITEPTLASALEVSRTPIREALFRLVGNGILTERGRGYCLPLLSRGEVAHMFHTRLLVEGGSTVASAFLSADKVDRLHMATAPMVIGGDGLPAIAGLGLERVDEAMRWRRVESRAIGVDRLDVLERENR